MIGVAILFGVGLLLLWLGAVVAVAWMLTHPPRRTYAAAVARGRPGDPSELDEPRKFEAWMFRSRGRELPVWEVEGGDPGGPVIVLTHGWADSRIGALPRVAALAPAASRLIAWDLPGHGGAPGVCELGMSEAEDLRALIDRVGRPVVLYGWSLGAGIGLAAAAERPDGVLAVIAESPYRLPATPARNVLAARGLPHRFVLWPALGLVRATLRRRTVFGAAPRGAARARYFDRALHAAGVAAPVLVLHGAGDEVCPIRDGREIAAAAPRGALAEIAGGHHNDLWTDPALAARCATAVHAFLRGLGADRT